MKKFVVFVLTAVVLFAQSEKKKLTFEVVSIKPHKPGDLSGMVSTPPGGRYTASNIGLRQIIQAAYVDYSFPVFGVEVTGLPEWAEKERYDVEAQPQPGFTPTKQQSMEMLQAMLEERFKLKIRRETRSAPIFALVVDKNGPKIKPAAGPRSCDARPVVGTKRYCANTGIEMLVIRLNSPNPGRTVVDRTGLTGPYDIDLQWAPDLLTNEGPLAPGAGIETGGPSLFTALPEQLGLRLVPETGQVDAFVVESVEKPSEN